MKIGNLEVYGIIYKIENKLNGKVYIGQTIQNGGFKRRYKYYRKTNIERVYKYHKIKKDNHEGYNEYLLSSINKYGFDNFDVCEVFDIAFSKEELNIKERLWIRYYRCIDNGYNFDEGGSRGRRSESTKEKLRIANLGKESPMKGKHHKKESNEINRLKHLGKAAYNKGIPLSEGIKKKISLAKKGKENKSCQIKVKCTTTGLEFNSIRQACKFYDIKSNHIPEVCKGYRNYCGVLKDGTKLKWEYLIMETIQ